FSRLARTPFLYHVPATSYTYTLSLHDALPIFSRYRRPTRGIMASALAWRSAHSAKCSSAAVVLCCVVMRPEDSPEGGVHRHRPRPGRCPGRSVLHAHDEGHAGVPCGTAGEEPGATAAQPQLLGELGDRAQRGRALRMTEDQRGPTHVHPLQRVAGLPGEVQVVD